MRLLNLLMTVQGHLSVGGRVLDIKHEKLILILCDLIKSHHIPVPTFCFYKWEP